MSSRDRLVAEALIRLAEGGPTSNGGAQRLRDLQIALEDAVRIALSTIRFWRSKGEFFDEEELGCGYCVIAGRFIGYPRYEKLHADLRAFRTEMGDDPAALLRRFRGNVRAYCKSWRTEYFKKRYPERAKAERNMRRAVKLYSIEGQLERRKSRVYFVRAQSSARRNDHEPLELDEILRQLSRRASNATQAPRILREIHQIIMEHSDCAAWLEITTLTLVLMRQLAQNRLREATFDVEDTLVTSLDHRRLWELWQGDDRSQIEAQFLRTTKLADSCAQHLLCAYSDYMKDLFWSQRLNARWEYLEGYVEGMDARLFDERYARPWDRLQAMVMGMFRNYCNGLTPVSS